MHRCAIRLLPQQVERAVQARAENLYSAFTSQPSPEALLKKHQVENARQDVIEGGHFAVKDNICTHDLPTSCASCGLQDYVSPFEATVVSKLREDGAILVGKTNMDEFGMGSHSTHSAFGPVCNPTSSMKPLSAGGSSGGSAVAVADELCDWALGTDTGGSVRLPAAYNGIIGFKPSYGLLSRWGVVAYANSLDTVGILSRTVDVTKKVFERIDFHDKKDPTSLSPDSRSRLQSLLAERDSKREWQSAQYLDSSIGDTTLRQDLVRNQIRIGVPKEYNIEELSNSVSDSWRYAINKLREAGAQIVPISLPSTHQALSAYYILAPAEASSNLAKYDGVRYGVQAPGEVASMGQLFTNTRKHGFGEEVRRRILLGAYSLSATAIDNYFIQAQKIRRMVKQDFDRVFSLPNLLSDDNKWNGDGVDAIICPTAPTPAPALEELETQSPLDVYAGDVFTVPASLAGLPAISHPVPSMAHTPGQVKWTGIQIITQYGDDRLALHLATWMQESVP